MSNRSPLKTQRCGLSSARHLRSLKGLAIIFQDKGRLELDSNLIRFSGRRQKLEIPLAAVTRVRLGSFDGFAKPGLKRIELSYRENGATSTVYLVPMKSALSFTWNTNRVIREWLHALEEALNRRHDVVQ